jgi:hypothetical protein
MPSFVSNFLEVTEILHKKGIKREKTMTDKIWMIRLAEISNELLRESDARPIDQRGLQACSNPLLPPSPHLVSAQSVCVCVGEEGNSL